MIISAKMKCKYYYMNLMIVIKLSCRIGFNFERILGFEQILLNISRQAVYGLEKQSGLR